MGWGGELAVFKPKSRGKWGLSVSGLDIEYCERERQTQREGGGSQLAAFWDLN